MPKKVVCKKCNYMWVYRGLGWRYALCPRCRHYNKLAYQKKGEWYEYF